MFSGNDSRSSDHMPAIELICERYTTDAAGEKACMMHTNVVINFIVEGLAVCV